jgi:hypothetical protein
MCRSSRPLRGFWINNGTGKEGRKGEGGGDGCGMDGVQWTARWYGNGGLEGLDWQGKEKKACTISQLRGY